MSFVQLIVVLCISVVFAEAKLTGKDLPRVEYSNSDQSDYRLPVTVQPIHYDLSLRPYFYNCTHQCPFTGSVHITTMCTADTGQIVLHAKQLNITSVTVNGVAPVEVGVDAERDFLILDLRNEALVGDVVIIEVEFAGILSSVTFGLFRMTYMEDKMEKSLVGTNFAPTSARKAFPCFDEPSLKATFNVSVTHMDTYHALSNMPVQHSHPGSEGWVSTMFRRTPPLPTYLVAVYITQYSYIETRTSSGVLIRTWDSSDTLAEARNTLELTKLALEMTEDYLGLTYPLAKIDQVSVPGFAYAGMENMGLVVYEQWILMDPMYEAQIQTICHELAHQWFGDVVTMKWWSDLWLKEGFSQYLTWTICDDVATKVKQNLFLNSFYPAWQKDSYELSQPLRLPAVVDGSDITQAYDYNILYCKGGLVVSTFAEAFGPEKFKLVLKDFIEVNSYRSVDQWDWFNSAQRVADVVGLRDGSSAVNMEGFMSSWLWQQGYPLVTVSRTTIGLFITQQRFVDDDTYKSLTVVTSEVNYTSPFNYRWEIPFRYITNSSGLHNSDTIIWLHQKSDGTEVITTPMDGSAWILGNPGVHGYYRINYDAANWNKLLWQMVTDHTMIPEQNRIQLISDSMALARHGLVSYLLPLSMGTYLLAEKEHEPWVVFEKEMSFLRGMLSAPPKTRRELNRYMTSLVWPRYQEATWRPEASDLDELIIRLSCRYGLVGCTKTALQFYSIRHQANISHQLEQVMYCTAMAQATGQEWDLLFNETRSTMESSMKTQLIGLTCTRFSDRVEKLIDVVMEARNLPLNLKIKILTRALENGRTRTVVLRKILQYQTVLQDQVWNPWSLNNLGQKLRETLNTKEQLDMVVAVLGSLTPEHHWLTSLDKIIVRNIRWMAQHLDQVQEWLDEINTTLTE